MNSQRTLAASGARTICVVLVAATLLLLACTLPVDGLAVAKVRYSKCLREQRYTEQLHADLHFELFQLDSSRASGTVESELDRSKLDALTFEHFDQHAKWRETCGAGGGGGGGQTHNDEEAMHSVVSWFVFLTRCLIPALCVRRRFHQRT